MEEREEPAELSKIEQEKELNAIMGLLISAELLINLSVRLHPMVTVRNVRRLKVIMKEIRGELSNEHS